MKKLDAKRSKHFKEFAAKVTRINLCIRTEGLDSIFGRFDELVAEYDEITKDDMYAYLELRRRVAESRVLASIDKKCAVEIVEEEFQKLEFLGYSDLHQKAVFYKILWHFMKDKETHNKARERLTLLRKELRLAMSVLREETASLEGLLK